MRYILLPDHSNWVRLIMNGVKDIEVRSGTRLFDAINRLKKEQGCAPCLIYVTKGQPCLFAPNDKNKSYFVVSRPFSTDYLNGKVIAQFEADAEEIGIQFYGGEEYEDYKEIRYETPTAEQSELLRRSCLTYQQIREYLGEYPKCEPIGTAIHIHNLKIFDKPKELKEFKHAITFCPLLRDNNFVPSFCKDYCEHNKDPERLDVYCDRMEKDWKPLTRAPQSWCYAEVGE